MKSYLRVKIKSLAAEARLIRHEELRVKGHRAHAAAHQRPTDAHDTERLGLYRHRTYDVRNEARAALVAYGFLRGRRYHQLEAEPSTTPNWRRVQELVSRYGYVDKESAGQRLDQWAKEA